MSLVTKNVFLAASGCPTAGWLTQRQPSSAPATNADQFRMDEGIEVQEMARQSFLDGVLVAERAMDAAVKSTAALLANPQVATIFEGAFIVDGYAARADILHRQGDAWKLIEVKSDTAEKPELLDDLAYTATVLERCGLPISQMCLYLISKDYRLGMPPSKLFSTVDRTQEVRQRMPKVLALWPQVRQVLATPTKPTATWAMACKGCEFFEDDCLGKGVENPIFDLPRLSAKRFENLMGQGLKCITDIPAGTELTEKQERVRRCVVSGKEHVERSLKAGLATVVWPAHYLDFETVMTAIPLYPDVAPYTQLPTQYSIHLCLAPGQVDWHRAYLADPTRDCRRELAERLIHDLTGRGSIIVYHAAFEKTVISKLAEIFSDLEHSLVALLPRVVDLEAILGDGYYHPGFHGSNSIKRTLPVMVTSLRYDDLEVGDGNTAVAAFARMAKGRCTAKEAVSIRQSLLAYCERDTLAMVKLHEALLSKV